MNPKEKADQIGRVSLRLLVAAATCLSVPLLLLGASGPSWWYNPAFTVSGTAPLVSGSAADYSAINQGQAKNIAVTAVNELNNDLAQFGGAGPTLNNLAITLTGTSSSTSDYSALNLGQLKALVQPFYDFLLAIDYKEGPLSSGSYPWLSSTTSAADYALANIGQAKFAFSFDVTYSSAGNGIPDWWVDKYFPGSIFDGVTGVNPNADVIWSGGQLTNRQAFQQGLNPLDYYNSQTPTLSKVSGDLQVGSSGSFVSAPLVVSVTDSNGNSLASAPVIFTVASGGGELQASSTGPPATSITALTGSSGQAQMYFQLAAAESNTSAITVTTGTGLSAPQVIFNEASDSGTGTYISPFAPSNVTGTINADGSETIAWQNNDNASPIYIYLLQASGTWTVSGTLAAGTDTYTISGSMAGLVEIGNNYTPGGSSGDSGGGGGGGGSVPPGAPPNTPQYAVPNTPPMRVPAAADSGYAVIDLGVGNTPLGINDAGKVLLSNTNGSYYTWVSGTATLLGTNAYWGPLQSGTVYAEVSSTNVNDENINGNIYSYNYTVLNTTGSDSGSETDTVTSGTGAFSPQLGIPDSTVNSLYAALTATALGSGTYYETSLSLGDPGTYHSGFNFGMVNDRGAFTYSAGKNFDGYSFGSSVQGTGIWGVSGWGSTLDGNYGYYEYLQYLEYFDWPDPPDVSGTTTAQGLNASLSPVEVNAEGVMAAVGSGSACIISSPGATPVNIPGCTTVAGVTDSSLGQGEGPYFLAGSGALTTLYCYNGGNPVPVSLNGIASGGVGRVSQRAISNHLVIPMGSQVWRNGSTHALSDLCGSGTNTWSNLSANGIAPGTDTMVGSGISLTDSSNHGVLLLPVQLTVSGSNIGQYGWIPGTSNTPPNVSKLMSPPFYMTATAKSIPGVTGSLNILQDCDVISAKVTYTDGSWTSCQPSGWLPDYNPWWLPTQSGPNAQGNLTCISSDQPRLPLSTAARNQVASVVYSGSLRDFVTLQISGSTQVVAEAVWSFNMSTSFTPNGVFQSYWEGVQQIQTNPTVPGTVYGATPTDQPVEPRNETGNDYILNSGNWHANGNNQSDYAHQYPYPIP